MIDRAGRGDVARPQTRRIRPGAAPQAREGRVNALRSNPKTRPAPGEQAPHLHLLSSVDRAIITAGIFTAVASAGFATYMVETDHSHPMFNGIEHLMIFAQPNRGVDQPLIARVPQTAGDQGVDYTSTGTIPGESAPPNVTPAYTLPALSERTGPIIEGFTLRGVSGNVAMVESADGIYRIEPGTTLPGAGRVIAIQWRKGKFVVVTTVGIIAEEEP